MVFWRIVTHGGLLLRPRVVPNCGIAVASKCPLWVDAVEKGLVILGE